MFKRIFVGILFVLCTALLLWSNVYWTKKGGVLDGAILNEEDIFLNEDRYVHKVLHSDEAVYLIRQLISVEGSDSLESELKEVEAFHKKLVTPPKLKDATVVSIVNVPCYGGRGKDFKIESCTNTRSQLYRSKYEDGPQYVVNTLSWGEFVSHNPSVSSLIGRADAGFVIFALYPKQGADEVEVFRSVVEVLEDREISALEWFIKSDIEPRDTALMVSGWIMGRGLIDGALNADILKTVTIGMIISTVLFIFFLGSVSQSLFSTLCIVLLSVVWMRGEIGLLDVLGFSMRERVYVLLAYTNCIVQGVSFSLHLFKSYNKYGNWDDALKKVKSLIGITCVISFFGFITLWSFEVLAIRELGIISACGVVNLYLISVYLVPVLYRFTPVQGKNEDDELMKMKLASFKVALFLLVVPLLISGAMIYQGDLVIKSVPGDYIKDTLVYRTAGFMSYGQNPGFDTIELFVEAGSEDVSELERFNETLRLMKSLHKAKNAREVYGVPNMLQGALREKFGKEFPTSQKELDQLNAEFGLYLNPFKEVLWNERGYRLSVSSSAESSISMRELRDSIVEIRKDFPKLKVSLFGKLAQYPSIDEYVVLGKPMNVITSQVSVIVLTAIWIFWTGYKVRKQKLGAIRGGIVMSVPFLFASACIVIFMVLADIPLDISTAVIGAMAINASIDFAIYFTNRFQKLLVKGEEVANAVVLSVKLEGKVILEDMVINMSIFFPLCFSIFQPVHNMGVLLIVVLAFSAIGTLVVMPALLAHCVRKAAP